MKKTYDTIDSATKQFKTVTGIDPCYVELENLYHEYRKNWKQFKNFSEWLINEGF